MNIKYQIFWRQRILYDSLSGQSILDRILISVSLFYSDIDLYMCGQCLERTGYMYGLVVYKSLPSHDAISHVTDPFACSI